MLRLKTAFLTALGHVFYVFYTYTPNVCLKINTKINTLNIYIGLGVGGGEWNT